MDATLPLGIDERRGHRISTGSSSSNQRNDVPGVRDLFFRDLF
jgi:hypothetical protein